MAHIISGETFRDEFNVAAQTLTARFKGPVQHEVAGTIVTGTTWSVSIQTQGWPPGAYIYEVMAEDALGNKWVVIRDRMTVEASLSDLPSDFETPSERMVRMIEAMISGNATAGVRRYKINNRELERYSIDELLKLLAYWKNRLAGERRKARGQNPLGPPIRVRF